MELEVLPGLLLPWYRENRRELPWRQTADPYRIWVSEIMLQQTRVEAVKGYYARFLDRLPDIAALANCDDDELHKLWEGLGYYSRVRNLKKAARVIEERHGGVFPSDHAAALALPGIGDYTAGAICSIAFSRPTPAVDGNVLRVLARLRADEEAIDLPQVKKRVREELAAIYPTDCPGEFTQALMELGATVCVPNGEPKCDLCPCREICQGRESWQTLPVKLPKRAKKQEDRTVFILRCGDRYAIEKRPSRGLLAGLWQFPNVAGHLRAAEAVAWAEERGLHPRNVEKSIDRNHIFTHIRWDLRGWFLEVDAAAGGFTWLTLDEIDTQAALPTAFRQFREEI
ncbi:MAG: A/G-specific adenine glycosylase [Oscillospiraceae bacterium]|nr:A/G-specific adenine glycosylase [Oscillospiraceae bacterium]